jgi:hypothetical protein
MKTARARTNVIDSSDRPWQSPFSHKIFATLVPEVSGIADRPCVDSESGRAGSRRLILSTGGWRLSAARP